MHRLLVLAALVACEPPEPAPASTTWTYSAPPSAWPLGEVRGRFGRSEPPQLARPTAIGGDEARGLTLPALWPVPGDGAARALVFGYEDGKPAVELVDIDAGRVVWRDRTTCPVPIVGVTSTGAVCGDANGARELGFDGKPRWSRDDAYVAVTGDRVAVAPKTGGLIVHDDATGEDTRVALPNAITPDSIVAACAQDAFAVTSDGKLARIANDAKGAPAIAWSVAVGTIAGLDACAGGSVLVTASSEAGTSLVAIARDGGKLTGRIDGVRGYWPARDGSDRIEVSAAGAVTSWPRELAGAPIALDLPVLAELLARRGERRLVRATRHTAALLDRHGVRAYLPLAELGAVLGDDHLLAGSWLGSPGETVHRVDVPPVWSHVLRVPPRTAGIALPAELRDLPRTLLLDETHAIAAGDAQAITAVALDAAAPRVAYAIADHGIARVDLAARAWTWRRADGCGEQPIALAIAQDRVLCASRDGVRATAGDGTPSWQWPASNVDAIAAAGDVAIVFDADRLAVLDANDGHALAHFASDDGAAMRAAVLDVAGNPVLVTAERGRLVARLPRADLLPVWSLEIDGLVRALAPAGDGVLVDLEDGDAYRVDARTANVVALPGIGLAWRAAGDVIAGTIAGEPTPPAVMPVPPPVIPRPRPLHDSPENPPNIATPWPVPPTPGPAAWQQTLYELTGAPRARDDYALPSPIAADWPRGPAGSPFVVAYGPGLREVLVIEAKRGDPVRRVQLPADAPKPALFTTVVDGKSLAGVVLANPLRVVLF